MVVFSGYTTESLLFLDDSFLVEFHQTLLDMQNSKQLTDILIKVGEESFSCHKMVLFASSIFFRQMFLNNPQESNLAEVELKGIDKPAVFSKILKYMYTGKIEMDVSNSQDIMRAQELLQLVGFKANCLKFVTECINPKNCIWLHTLAKQYEYVEVAERAKAVMLRQLKEVMKTPEFLAMTEHELTEYLSDDQLEVQSENLVFSALKAWIQARFDERKGSFVNIVKCIRLPLCSGNFLYNVVRHEPLMADVDCQRLLSDAVFYQQAPEQRRELVNPRNCQREDLKVVALGGLCTDDATNIQCWILEEGSSQSSPWEQMSDLSQNLRGISACMTQKGIMVTGGRTGPNAVKDCFMLDIKSRKNPWTTGLSMAVARCSHRSLCYGNAVYVLGGWNKKCLASVEMFDMQERAWIEVAPLEEAVQQSMVTVCMGRLFAFGGHNGTSWQCCTQEYNAEQQTWSTLAEMPVPCMAGGAVGVDHHVLVVGGWNKCCMRYDLSTNTWTQLTRPFEEHWNAPALTWKGRILVWGGYHSTSVEQYDPQSDAWTKRDLTMPKELWKPQMMSVCLPLSLDFSYLDTLVVFGGAFDWRNANRTCWYLQGGGSTKATWKELTEVPYEHMWFSACVTRKGIVLTGGRDKENNYYNGCWLFECYGQQWTPLPPMNEARNSHASVCYGNAVYVMGGWNRGCIVSVEKFDLQTHVWQKVAPMEKAVQKHMATECRQRMFAFGGTDDGRNWFCCTQEYLVQQDKWIFRAEMPVACEGGGVASINGQIFVVGGQNKCCMHYDTSTDAWTLLKRPLENHKYAPALAWRGKIFVLGGLNTSTVEQYDPDSNEWSKWQLSMPEAVWMHQVMNVHLG